MTNKTEKPKQKTYWDVKVETICPVLITYRVYAEDEDTALQEIKRRPPTSIRPNIAQKRDIKATIYNAGSLLIKKVFKF
jgi:hypothetical protein